MKVTFSQKTNQKPTRQRNQPSANSSDSVKSYLQAIGRIPLLTAVEEITLGQQVQTLMALQAEKAALIETLGHPPTHREWAAAVNLTSAKLKKTIQVGEKAKQRMIEANLRLVVSIAKKYQRRNLDFLDLIQEGSIGLERGVEKYDPSKGYKFSTYGYWWIRQAITRAIAQQSRTIRLPIHITEKLNKIKRTQRELSQSLGRTPTTAEVAEHLNTSIEDIKHCLEASHLPLSLDMQIGDDQNTELQELLENDEASPEQAVTQLQMQEDMQHLLEQLTPTQQEIISLRFGLKTGEALSLSSVGEKLGLSRERVRQLQQSALKRLRLRKDGIRDYLIH
ncbi:MAG: RpoD/SigA family RNA polymerase sigma factor [Phormidesmis sp.]